MQFIDLKTQYQRIKEDVNQRIQAVLEHGCYINGPEIAELEQQLAAYVGAKHAVGVSSGTDALLVAMMALDIGHGDEVITTPFSFFATVETICLLGAKPVFVDIDPQTYNIDPAGIEAAITDKTKGIITVSLYGQVADMDAVNSIAAKHNIPVIEDAAQSFGAVYKDKQSCNLSTIACTSFFPAKPLGAYGDAGGCFTNDDALEQRMRQIRNHGQEQRYYHGRVGINGRLDSIQAAILQSKLAIFSDEVKARQQVANRYDEQLKNIVRTPTVLEHNTSIYAQYTIEVDNREQVLAQLKDQGIPTAVHYPLALHQQPAMAHLGYNTGDFPIAEAAANRVMSLPMHPYLTEEQQQQIVDALISVVTSAAA